jgi:hypothetical protein
MPGIRDQRAWLFLPDDPRLRIRAAEIAEQRRHTLRRRDDDGEEAPRREPPAGIDLTGEQLSLFAPLSAVAVGDAESGPWLDAPVDDWTDGHDGSIEVELGPPPPLGAVGAVTGGLTRRELKDRLRAANAEAAKDIARMSGLTHAQVNLELNRQAGVRRIHEATEVQLTARLQVARRWQWRLGR